ncbi:MAG TPA: hypothetical protein VED40_23045 [Azospirillaceae bacterium]|nr:hypothetical protein [Azospirillaceae bacterium]
MVAEATQWSRDRERAFLEEVRVRYEQQGFRVLIEPGPDDVPPFLRGLQPDALALKHEDNRIIEVKARRTESADISLSALKNRIRDQAGWKLDVYFAGDEEPKGPRIPPQDAVFVRSWARKVDALAEEPTATRAAFLLAWSILEAAAASVENVDATRIHSPKRLVQFLTMHGYISQETADDLRKLGDLRSSVAHGDLTSEVTPADVRAVLAAVDEATSIDGG